MTTEELLEQNLRLVKTMDAFTEAVNEAIAMLAGAVLELEDPEANHCLGVGRRNALKRLTELADMQATDT